MTEKTDKVIPFPTMKSYLEETVSEIQATELRAFAIITIDKEGAVSSSHYYDVASCHALLGAMEILKRDVMAELE